MPTIRMRAVGWTPEVFELTEEQQRVTLHLWLSVGAKVIEPPWKPTFEPQRYVTDPYYGRMVLNVFDYATEETATAILHRFGGARTVQVPYIENSPDSSDAKQWWVVFADGIAVNAGELASYFVRAPEDTMPGSAEKQALATIARARQEGAKLPASVSAPNAANVATQVR